MIKLLQKIISAEPTVPSVDEREAEAFAEINNNLDKMIARLNGEIDWGDLGSKKNDDKPK